MSTTFTIKRGDTLPLMRCTLTQDASPIDLTTATAVEVYFSSATEVFTRSATVAADPTTGVVTYAFQDSDWLAGQFAVGGYKVEIQVTFTDGTILSIPTSGYGKLVVKPDLSD